MGRWSRDILACSGLLWLPYLFLELLSGYSRPHIWASPALFRACMVIAGILALLAGIQALAAMLAVRLFAGSRDLEHEIRGSLGCGVATLGSVATLLIHPPIRDAFVANQLPMPVALCVAAHCGAAAAGIVVVSSVWFASAAHRRSAARIWLAASMLGWLVLLGQRVETPAGGWIVAMSAVALLSTISRTIFREADRSEAWIRAASIAEGFALSIAIATVGFAGSSPLQQQASTKPSDPGQDNVILIVVDTLRADHTSLGGYEKDTTPNLRRLADGRASYFSRAWSGAPHTLGSVYALFTSRFAARKPIPPDGWTIASAFQRKGYRTAAFTANGIIDEVGLRRGFGEFWNLGGLSTFHSSYILHELLAGGEFWSDLELADALNLHKESSEVMSNLAADWISSSKDVPFFLYLHYMDPHWPYHERGFDTLPSIEGPPYSHIDLMKLKDGAPENAKYRQTPELRELIARYDEEIRATDQGISDVVEHIGQLGLEDSTWIVVVGDHGEEFFEHNGFGHGHDVFEEQLNVPMLILWPDRPEFASVAERIDTPVSLIDILPTFTDYLALSSQGDGLLGRSLRDVLVPEQGIAEPPVVAVGWGKGRKNMASYLEGSLKVRLRVAAARRGAGAETYDLSQDPREQTPLSAKHDPSTRELMERARKAVRELPIWKRARPPAKASASKNGREPEDEAMERLRALGYVE